MDIRGPNDPEGLLATEKMDPGRLEVPPDMVLDRVEGGSPCRVKVYRLAEGKLTGGSSRLPGIGAAALDGEVCADSFAAALFALRRPRPSEAVEMIEPLDPFRVNLDLIGEEGSSKSFESSLGFAAKGSGMTISTSRS